MAAEAYYKLARSTPIRPWDYGDPSLHSMLAIGGCHSNLQTVMSTYDKPGSAVIALFAARMLLEEPARLVLRFAIPEEVVFKARARQFFDEYLAHEKKTIDTLALAPYGDARCELRLSRETEETVRKSHAAGQNDPRSLAP